MAHELQLPSGLVIEAVDLDGAAVIKIAERVGSNASGASLAALMEATTKRVIDPGPYPTLRANEGVSNWLSLLWGDLFAAIVWLRVTSFPDYPDFDFEFSCSHCRALQPYSIPLREYFEDPDHFRPLPEESKEALLAGRFFETKLPKSGRTVTFDLARAEHDEPMRVLLQRENRRRETDVETIAKRVKSISGVENKTGPIKDLRGLWRWIGAPGNMVAQDIDHLLAEMRAVDIHVDAEVLAWCTNYQDNCGRQSPVTLPLNTSFFRPRSGTKRGATAKRGASPSSSQA